MSQTTQKPIAEKSRWSKRLGVGCGVVVALAERTGLPVHAVGVGEGIDDLRDFDPAAFARGLLGLAP